MKLREARRSRKWAQEDVARRLQVVESTVSHWETGRAVPSRLRRQKLAKIFQANLDWSQGNGTGTDE